MRTLLLSLCITSLVSFGLYGQSIDLEDMCSNYEHATTDKDLCKTMLEAMEQNKEYPVYLAYLGGLQSIWANHVRNPITKLKTFNKGKENLEKAFLMDSDNIEIRFIRWSVQKNAPKFLGYYQQIEEDEKFIKDNKHKIQSESLKQLVHKSHIE